MYVFREDYLLAIRRLSRSHDPAPYARMLHKAQLFSAAWSFDSYEAALKDLKQSNAFSYPNEAKLNISKH